MFCAAYCDVSGRVMSESSLTMVGTTDTTVRFESPQKAQSANCVMAFELRSLHTTTKCQCLERERQGGGLMTNICSRLGSCVNATFGTD